MSSFIAQNLTEIEAVTGYTFAFVCDTAFRVLFCLQISCQPFYLSQLLKFHPFDLSSNRGPGYSPQNGIAPTSGWVSSLYIFINKDIQNKY